MTIPKWCSSELAPKGEAADLMWVGDPDPESIGRIYIFQGDGWSPYPGFPDGTYERCSKLWIAVARAMMKSQ